MLEKSKEGHMNVNYNFLVKIYSELTNDQKIKFNKNLNIAVYGDFKSLSLILAPRAGLEPATN